MPRVQTNATDEQLATLRNESVSSGRPVADLLREAVIDWIARSDRNRRWERALSVVGIGNSGLGDLAENHDYYLGEDFNP